MFEMKIECAPGRVVLALRGEFDLASVEQFQEALRSAPPEPELLLDLSGLDFMDSTGLHEVLKLDQLLRDRGATLMIVRGPANIQRVFQLTDLEGRFQFVDPSEAH